MEELHKSLANADGSARVSESELSPFPTREEWEYIEEVVKFLEPFKRCTVKCCGSTYPTSSSVVPMYDYLLKHCEATKSQGNTLGPLNDPKKLLRACS